MPLINLSSEYSKSDLKVFITKYRSDADIIVFLSENQSRSAKSLSWYITENISKCDKKIKYVNNRSESDLAVFITDKESEAKVININALSLLQ
jgi:hypothetical protein